VRELSGGWAGGINQPTDEDFQEPYGNQYEDLMRRIGVGLTRTSLEESFKNKPEIVIFPGGSKGKGGRSGKRKKGTYPTSTIWHAPRRARKVPCFLFGGGKFWRFNKLKNNLTLEPADGRRVHAGARNRIQLKKSRMANRVAKEE